MRLRSAAASDSISLDEARHPIPVLIRGQPSPARQGRKDDGLLRRVLIAGEVLAPQTRSVFLRSNQLPVRGCSSRTARIIWTPGHQVPAKGSPFRY